MSKQKAWIGVDLDGTLAEQGRVDWPEIGKPVPLMVERVKSWLARGKCVKIVTARASQERGDTPSREELITAVEDWCEKHLGKRLEVTCSKDYMMYELWDDRAIRVEHNTGRRIE